MTYLTQFSQQTPGIRSIIILILQVGSEAQVGVLRVRVKLDLA